MSPDHRDGIFFLSIHKRRIKVKSLRTKRINEISNKDYTANVLDKRPTTMNMYSISNPWRFHCHCPHLIIEVSSKRCANKKCIEQS